MHFLKTLHLFGVCLFLGNVIVSALWKVMADRSGNVAVIRYATRLVNVTDLAFTAVGATLLAVTGHLLATDYGGVHAWPWIWQAYALFAVSGLIWLAVLLPIQIAQARLLRGRADDAPLPQRYWPLARWWSIAGTLATVALLPALWLMVDKTGF
ncbi:DUF2269 family protein [Chitinolyticbacter meiyuanensis]|uniref:DUF2269 family protein n=1 Tax=Chitinolyticbacter meiyuanensis TaxID=682798 RepID=UPI0011E5FA51|nr:DUF2269 family protein [Chitinolyticbacter meiyuanensis]